MKNNYFFSIRFYLTICFISSLFFNSCGKKGCSDKAALNYESGITKDDGTCTYNADKLIGTWNDSYTYKGSSVNYSATIINDESDVHNQIRITIPIETFYGVSVNWVAKTLGYMAPGFVGSIKNENDFQFYYTGYSVDTAFHHFTR